MPDIYPMLCRNASAVWAILTNLFEIATVEHSVCCICLFLKRDTGFHMAVVWREFAGHVTCEVSAHGRVTFVHSWLCNLYHFFWNTSVSLLNLLLLAKHFERHLKPHLRLLPINHGPHLFKVPDIKPAQSVGHWLPFQRWTAQTWRG